MGTTNFTVNKDGLKVEMERIFNAPRERVWQAHIDPQLLVRWWGPSTYEMTIEELNPVPGGTWRILHRGSEGQEHWFRGEFKEVLKPEKLVRTFIYEPSPEYVMTETCLFEETTEGQTKLINITQFPSAEALQGMVGSGMEWGARESIDRLAKLVET